MLNISSPDDAAPYLNALEQQLGLAGVHFELVVAGGSALLALDLISRSTHDVDVIALRERGELQSVDPLPEPLRTARARVARDFQLPLDWLNGEASSLLEFGLPNGFLQRAKPIQHGPALTVWYASRFDQIHFKLYATVDQGPGKHEADLRALEPTAAELLEAARWSRTHDPSEGYREVLSRVLRTFGVENAPGGP